MENVKGSIDGGESTSDATSSESLPDLIDVIKHGKLCDAGAAMFSEYCDCSTIHGVRYLGERKRSWIEKVFWIIIFAISIYICFYLIGNIRRKWNQTPVIVSFSDKATPVWTVPLPTFTICLDIKSRSEIFRFDAEVQSLSENITSYLQWDNETKAFFDASLQVCDFTKTEIFNFTDDLFPGSLKNTLQNMAPLESDAINFTSFQGNVHSGESLFEKVLTEMGICYSFNLMKLEDTYREGITKKELIFPPRVDRTSKWTLEGGFADIHSEVIFPFRSYSAFIEHGLVVVLEGNKDDTDIICGEGDEGYKIAVTAPGDVPQLSRQFFSIPFNYEVLIDISPHLITTEDEADEYPPELRGCFYTNERYLEYFNSYTQSNCELECLTKYTLEKCGCVRFNMPRMEGTSVCGAGKIKCYLEAKTELLENDFMRNSENTSKSLIPDCKCWPTCTSLSYRAGITQAPLHESIKKNDMQVTMIKLYYKDNRFWSSERSKLYGIIDFTANVGGLLGLFMGISVISVVEVIYFFTLRLMGNLQLRCQARLTRISRIGVSMLSLGDSRK